MKRGFTLLELSIVLVIIGLIVGGVVAGQELIRNAEINNDVQTFARIDTMVNTFRFKYDAIPGDFKNAEAYWGDTVTSNGNGDGTLQQVNGSASTSSGAWTGEYPQFWIQLGLAAISEPYDGTVANGFPMAQSAATGFVATGLGNAGFNILNLGYGRLPALPTNLDSADDIRPWQPAIAQQIDRKIDDGNGLTGRFIAAQESANICHTSGIYTVSNDANSCRPRYVLQ